MRVIGVDVARSVAKIASLQERLLRAGGRIFLSRPESERFAQRLGPQDPVVLEATGNTTAFVSVLKAHAGRVVIANPLAVGLVAEAKIKADKIDAAVLAQCTLRVPCRKCGFQIMRSRRYAGKLPAEHR